MSDATLQFLGTILVALIALATSVYAVLSQKGMRKADVSEKLATASQMTIDDLIQQIASLNIRAATMLLQTNDLKQAAKRSLELIARLLQALNMLLTQLRMAGMAPDWTSDPEIDRLVALCFEESTKVDIKQVSIALDVKGSNGKVL
jgi:hypothetical protein